MATVGAAAGSSKRPYKQDLPPKGGYGPIDYKRIPIRRYMSRECFEAFDDGPCLHPNMFWHFNLFYSESIVGGCDRNIRLRRLA